MSNGDGDFGSSLLTGQGIGDEFVSNGDGDFGSSSLTGQGIGDEFEEDGGVGAL